ncbi:ketopantoate reductase PanE/ApbA C terminal-domain-containing protein [Ampelomyces quisqualis]|uniref:2-dehydropantoate 2-reductase n=1 Tax=Ampelomyces quisqualis TaxID=50730 RepID=A0A6A5QCY6_AMPQU|nr:ketopantoate reductase PanE/ApbA C terminal-domain-containing protein [Ampelomyces quisqualis]
MGARLPLKSHIKLTGHRRKMNDSTGTKGAHNATDFYRADPVMDRRIHVMGVGNVGKLVAHALRGIPNPPPVTLIFSKWDMMTKWSESPRRLTVVTDGDAEIREGFDAEIAIPRLRYHHKEVGLNASSAVSVGGSSKGPPQQALAGESTEPISSLIICSKAPFVLQGLSSVKHRLDKNSVILFLQNGMGIAEEVSKEIFPDPVTRPHYMLGINSHGVNNTSGELFTTTHAGFGTISLGILPHERDRDPNIPYEPDTRFTSVKNSGPIRSKVVPLDELNPEYPPPMTAKFHWTPNQRYLLRTILRAPVLGASSFSPPDLLQMQLEKLAVNCIVNPLTVLLDARNGALLYNYALTRTMRLLLSEISLVIRTLPELQYIPNVQSRFDPGRLETIVVGVANKTKDNISSMLADTRVGRQTEIDYINGWIVKRGEELGLRCLMNYMLMQMVKGKAGMISREVGEGVPFVQDGRGGDVELKDMVARKKDEENSDEQ